MAELEFESRLFMLKPMILPGSWRDDGGQGWRVWFRIFNPEMMVYSEFALLWLHPGVLVGTIYGTQCNLHWVFLFFFLQELFMQQYLLITIFFLVSLNLGQISVGFHAVTMLDTAVCWLTLNQQQFYQSITFSQQENQSLQLTKLTA